MYLIANIAAVCSAREPSMDLTPDMVIGQGNLGRTVLMFGK